MNESGKQAIRFDGANISVAEAARIMKKDAMFIRVGLRNGKLPFGTAIKTSEDNQNYDYYISPKKFYEYTGYMPGSEEG